MWWESDDADIWRDLESPELMGLGFFDGGRLLACDGFEFLVHRSGSRARSVRTGRGMICCRSPWMPRAMVRSSAWYPIRMRMDASVRSRRDSASLRARKMIERCSASVTRSRGREHMAFLGLWYELWCRLGFLGDRRALRALGASRPGLLQVLLFGFVRLVVVVLFDLLGHIGAPNLWLRREPA